MVKRESTCGTIDHRYANGFNSQERVEQQEGTAKDIHPIVTLMHIEFRESDALTTIDGFLVTTGSKARMIISAKLTQQEKECGRMVMLKHLLCNRGAQVYLWSNLDE